MAKTLTLKEAITEYLKVQEKLEQLGQREEELKEIILNQMENEKISSFQDNEVEAKVTGNITFSYTDEQAIIKYLNNHGYKGFIKNTINKTALNKELKGGTQLTEALASYYQKKEGKKLSVKSLVE